MPMVVMNDGVKESSLNRSRQHDLPTPESPMSRSLICAVSVLGRSSDPRPTYEKVVIPCAGHGDAGGVLATARSKQKVDGG